MTGVSGTMFGSKTMVYNDDNRLTSSTYGGVTDLYYYTHTGLRYRARLGGTYYRYLYNGERVLEELNDSGTMQARYTTEDGSYYGQWLHLYRTSGTLSRFPMYDNIGTARGLVDVSGTVTDSYELDTFGRSVSSSGTTPNPYRFGGAWGYITDPSGMLQLGARFYWPEVGRFVSHDPIREGMNWYAYVGDNPVVWTDPTGLACVPYLKRHYKIRHNTDVGDWSTWTLTHVHYVELPYLPYNEVNCSWMRTRQLHGYYERYFKVWWLCWRPCKGAYTKVTESPHIKQWKTLTERQRTVTWHYGWVDEYQAVWWCRTHPPS